MSYVLLLRKESFKFSCSHFTIFSATHAERLHGHNYRLSVNVALKSLDQNIGMAFDFNEIKPVIQKTCNELDEYILIAEKSPYLEIKKVAKSIEVNFAKKNYVFPLEDVRLLPIVNVSTEELARYVSEKIVEYVKPKKLPIHSISVTVKETQGQGVSYAAVLNSD